MLSSIALSLLTAVGARWAFEEAYASGNEGDWYIDADNESATLAWGESYIMMALATMYRTTGHPMYLDRLAYHLDGILAARDDARGVEDYRGISGACWRNTSYQDGAYCYVAHTGMLIYPMAQFAELVDQRAMGDVLADDGESYGDKAARFLAAAEESVAYHEDQWDPEGFYRARDDATFISFHGRDLPFNQYHALGRALIVLGELTGNSDHTQKAEAMAKRFKSSLFESDDGAYLWSYWSTEYAFPGEDISHAAINVDFAALAARHGIVFTDADLEKFALTFVGHIYVDDETYNNNVDGGGINDAGQRPQTGRWLALSPYHPLVYSSVRSVFDSDYRAGMGGAGTVVGWANLAAHEPFLCSASLPASDWGAGDLTALKNGAAIETQPVTPQTDCMARIVAKIPERTSITRGGGTVARWNSSESFRSHYLARVGTSTAAFVVETALSDAGAVVLEPPPTFTAPSITSEPPTGAHVGELVEYTPSTDAQGLVWWSLQGAPKDARIDPKTGTITWTPTEEVEVSFILELRTEATAVEQRIEISVPPRPDMGTDDTATGSSGAATESSGASSPGLSGGDGTSNAEEIVDSCACTNGSDRSLGWLFSWFGLVALARRRKRERA